jgi:hypothetical protein
MSILTENNFFLSILKNIMIRLSQAWPDMQSGRQQLTQGHEPEIFAQKEKTEKRYLIDIEARARSSSSP